MGYRHIRVEPLTPLIGAEVTGVTLRDCSEEEFAEIEQAWAAHLVLFFRDQELTVEEQIQFAEGNLAAETA